MGRGTVYTQASSRFFHSELSEPASPEGRGPKGVELSEGGRGALVWVSLGKEQQENLLRSNQNPNGPRNSLNRTWQGRG